MKPLIERSFSISASALKSAIERLERSDNKMVSDHVNLLRDRDRMGVNYWLEPDGFCYTLNISAEGEPQEIIVTTLQPQFGGTRYYFDCPFCNRRCGKLYLSPNDRMFKCNKHFAYEATTFNRQSKLGFFTYQHSRSTKLIDQREAIGRIWYRHGYTKRFNRWLNKCARAGFTKEVRSAEELLRRVKTVLTP